MVGRRFVSMVLTVFGSLILWSHSVGFAEVMYVDADATGGAPDGSSWENAWTDVQDALAAAVAGDEVWIADGSYRPDRGTGDLSASFVIPSGVALLGGFGGDEEAATERDPVVHVVILDGYLGDLPGSVDHAFNVVRMEDADAGTILDGLTIQNGRGSQSFGDVGLYQDRGGGMVLVGSSPRIRRVRFQANHASPGLSEVGAVTRGSDGGAVLCAAASSPVFEHCAFVGNRAGDGGATSNSAQAGGAGGAVAIDSGSSAVFRECSFTENKAGNGGEVEAGQVGGVGGFGGAVYVENEASARFESCMFHANEAGAGGDGKSGNGRGGSGGAIATAGSPTIMLHIERCQFHQNASGDGALPPIAKGAAAETAAPSVDGATSMLAGASCGAIAVGTEVRRTRWAVPAATAEALKRMGSTPRTASLRTMRPGREGMAFSSAAARVEPAVEFT